jgi:Protein of unknown function DUF86
MCAPPPSAMRFMHSDRTREALLNILENATLAQSFVGDMNLSDFAADRRTFYATVRCLEIISEASRHLDEGLLARHPELPWRAIRSTAMSIATITTIWPKHLCCAPCATACRRFSRRPARTRRGVMISKEWRPEFSMMRRMPQKRTILILSQREWQHSMKEIQKNSVELLVHSGGHERRRIKDNLSNYPVDVP